VRARLGYWITPLLLAASCAPAPVLQRTLPPESPLPLLAPVPATYSESEETALAPVADTLAGQKESPPSQFLTADVKTCGACSGAGTHVCSHCQGRDLTRLPCKTCAGRDLTKLLCRTCAGRDLTRETCSFCRGLDLTKLPCKHCGGRDLTLEVCNRCNGSGFRAAQQCYSCSGTGRRNPCYMCGGRGTGNPCYVCAGRGRKNPCYACNGRARQNVCYTCSGRGTGNPCYMCSGRGAKACQQCNGGGYVEETSIASVNGLSGLPRAENGSYYGEVGPNGLPKTVFVRGHYQRDGTYSPSHYRSLPSLAGAARGPPLSVAERMSSQGLSAAGARSAPAVAENGSYYGEPNQFGVPKTVHVRGYFRKDGTYVRSHYRSPPYSNPPSLRSSSGGSTYVRGHFRKDGTYVRGHTRRR
jgi:hypothetical protein